jgi:rRNA maturation endonuclease Nob1
MVENAATRRFLVLDASAWIHASESWLQRAALEKDLQLCTVPDVLHEVRDEAARKRLEWLLGLKSGGADDARALTVSEPSPKAVACVERAARETGDLGFLSTADVSGTQRSPANLLPRGTESKRRAARVPRPVRALLPTRLTYTENE